MSSKIPAIEPIKVIAKVLQTELNLVDGQVMLGLTNWEIPNTPGLYIALFYGPEQVIGNNSINSVDDQGNYIQINDVIMLHTIDIDIMSFDESARTRKEEVLMVLQSYTANQAMESNSMRFASTPGSFISVDDLEPSKQLNRFKLSILVNALHQQTKGVPYYDTIGPVGLVVDP